MNLSTRISAVFAYIPVLGWVYVYLFQRKNTFAIFHLKQSIGIVLYAIITFLIWLVVAWLIALIPYMAVYSVSLFAIVIAAYIYGFILWITGILNALRERSTPLPAIGQRANRLPIG